MEKTGSAVPDYEGVIEALEKQIRITESVDGGWVYLTIEKARKVLELLAVAKDINVPDKWISVKDRLPKDDREVLVAYKMTGKDVKFWGVETASCIAGNGEVNWISLWDEYRILNGSKRVITHWMLLPEPPKEESND